jgi:LmbE family N-acetylglucosaminyl deacetylase
LILVAVVLACIAAAVLFGVSAETRAEWHTDATRVFDAFLGASIEQRKAGAIAMTPRELGEAMHLPDGRPRRVVVIVPHMDDESLFLGETLAALHARGVKTTLIFTTSSQGGRAMDPRYERDRHWAYRQVAPVLGVTRSIVATIPDGARLGGLQAKSALTEAYVRNTGLMGRDMVLFAIEGGGQYDHQVADIVGRRLAREYDVPLFTYWGYGRRFKWRTEQDKDWGPNMRPANLVGEDHGPFMKKKRQAILIYRNMYFKRGWVHYWVSIGRFELRHHDELGFVAKP